MTLSLTPAQRDQIRIIQQQSFKRYCEKFGYDEHEHAALLLSLAKRKLEGLLGHIRLDDITDVPTRQHLQRLVNAGSFLDLRHEEYEQRRIGYATSIANAADRLPISYDYLARLCERLGLAKPSRDQPRSVSSFLQAVPLLTSWELELNAFVSGSSTVDKLPYVCIYEALLSACDSFLDSVAPVAIDFGSKARARTPSSCAEIGSQSEFMERLQSCFRLLLGESNYAFANADQIDRRTRFTITAMTEGAVQTVWFHELGHLLMGHTERPVSHSIEFEADRFALQMLAADTSAPDLMLWLALGSMTVWTLLWIIETARGLAEQQSHPSARRRVQAALAFWEETSPQIARAVRGYLASLVASCNPTLQKYWNVSLPLS